MKDYKNYSLLAHNTFGIDVRCSRFVEFETIENAQILVGGLTEKDYPLLIIGGGSNLLLTGDYLGTVIHSTIKGKDVVGDNDESVYLRCGSGEVWDEVVDFCVANHLYGMENLSLIPGEVGASAVQNIGAYGVEAKDLIVKVEAVEIATGKIVSFSNADCEYSYRQSKFKKVWRDQYLVTYVTYALNKHFIPKLDYGNIMSKLGEGFDVRSLTAKQLRDAIIEIRNEKLPDPKVEGNAGSFFMNPIIEETQFKELQSKFPNIRYYEIKNSSDSPKASARYKIPAGWMIEQCGWKGKTLGKAGVHVNQALVLVNKGGAKGDDIIQLCQTIQNDVKHKFDIDIYPEVNIK